MTPNASPRPWRAESNEAGITSVVDAHGHIIVPFQMPRLGADGRTRTTDDDARLIVTAVNAYGAMRDALEAARDMLTSARAVEHAYACRKLGAFEYKDSDLCVKYGLTKHKITAALAKAGEGVK